MARISPEYVREWWKEIILIVVGCIGATGLLIQIVLKPLLNQPWDMELAGFCAGCALGLPLAGIEFVRKGEKAE